MNNVEPLTQEHVIQLGEAFFGSAIGFYIFYELIYYLYERRANEKAQESVIIPGWLIEYKKWTSMQRADFVSRITSQIHALIAVGFSLKALFFTCIEPRSDDTVDYENGKLTNFFHSEYCLMEHIAMAQIISLAITAGYLTFDIYICYAKIQDTSKLQVQTYIHHAVGISGIISAIFYGRGGALIITNVLLINELSTIFLNFRQFLLIFKMNDGKLYSLNAILFFLAFFFSRIVFNTLMTYYAYLAFAITIKDKGVFGCPWWQIVLGFYLILLFIVINVLNAIWFIGIVKHLLRNIGLMQSPHVPKNPHKEEDVEEQPLINADEDQAAGDRYEVMAEGLRESVNADSQGPSARSSGASNKGLRKRDGKGSGSDY